MQERSEASWEGWENALAGPSDEKLGDFYYHNSRTPEMVRGLKKYLTEKEDLKKALNS
ncbi:MAG: hypothetical protein LBD11_03155 [Candidatus Peribacteria bacterium]|jgi:hypothetical protein|nr:hypothetical protein [Candidatus Peribacteria bacterium]